MLVAEGGGGQLLPRACILLHLLHLPLLAAQHPPAAARGGVSALVAAIGGAAKKGASAAGGGQPAPHHASPSSFLMHFLVSLYGREAVARFVLAQRWLAVYGSGMVLPWMGVWMYLECAGHGWGFLGDELGHLIPVSCQALAAVVSLLYLDASHSHAARIALLRLEGRLTFVLGALFLAEHTAGQKGGVLYPLLHGGKTSSDWMKNQQHTFDGMVWLACGLLALVCAEKNLATGLHFLVPALFNVHMMFSHPQHCNHESWGHWLHAIALAIGALFRAAHRPVEWSFFALLAALLFVGASPCAVEWWAANVTVVAQGLLTAAVAAGVWALHAWLWLPCAVAPPELPPAASTDAVGRVANSGGGYTAVTSHEVVV